jgi:iron(III) transport system substrate-binding protein
MELVADINCNNIVEGWVQREETMITITRRTALIAGLTTAFVRPSFAAANQPAKFSDIDVDKAKADGKVVLYTSLDTKVVDSVIAGFKEKYGISVQYFRGGGADVTSKVLAESDAGQIQADIVDSADMSAILLMKQKGILRPFTSEAASVVPSELRDPEGYWIADRLTQAVIQFNTNEFGSAPPKHGLISQIRA